YVGPNTSQPDVLQDTIYCNNTHPNPPCAAPPTMIAPILHAARSRHPGGVQVTMGDGSGRFISDNIGLGVWRALCSTRAGDTVPDDAVTR
ncbi:MAG: DUF1559 domain-containing protein, partial [Planctomycetes bacterium]|nr:DUF1559 domain-containing protein [Planctomycetota bacterium]